MGSVALTGCGDNGGSTTAGKPAALSGSGGGSSAQEQGTTAVRSAYSKTAEGKTARTTLLVKADADGRSVTTHGEGAIDLTRGESTMALTADGKTIEQRVVDQVLYQKVPDQEASSGKPWLKIDLKKAAQQQSVNPQQIGAPAQSAAYAKAITDKGVTTVGTEKIDGVDTTRYKVSVDMAKLPGSAQLRRELGPTPPMWIWLDDQGRIRREQIDMTVKAPTTAQPVNGASPGQMKVSTMMQFSDFGTKVDVKAPPTAQVTDITTQALQGSRKQG
ncbi:hypothetical protein [Streptomyces broussonetiae]|uniref:hypothetical protein n=1 Tax=Streptomyces broussonetiae TaxID=2686304 RepID=UPI0035E3A075